MKAGALLLAMVAFGYADVARADVQAECVSAYDQTQALRKQGNLVEARQRALACSQPTCPGVVSKDCAQWLGEIDASLPTVVFSAELDGNDTAAVRVLLDGKPITDRLDGKAVSIDPGEHSVRFEMAGADPIEQTVVIAQGQKDRSIRAAFKSKKAASSAPSPASAPVPSPPADTAMPLAEAPPDAPAGGVPAWAWVIGGVGVASAGVGVGLLVASVLGQSEITDHCGKSPAEPGYDAGQCQTLGSDNDLKQGLAGGFGGVGVVAIVVAIVGIATAPSSDPPAAASASVHATPWLRWGAGGISVGGEF